MSIDSIPYEAMLEGLAEEAAELAQAALKVARVLREENPTPVTYDVAIGHLVEELADVLTYMQELEKRSAFSLNDINQVLLKKQNRWEDRLNDSTK